jgi:Predicted ATPase (AAA+ superfamily)
MEDAILDQLILNSEKQQQWVRRFSTKRYLYEALKKIDRDYYRGIKGIRGVGKTVLMLQLARETKGSLYISADSTILKPFTLYEIVKELNKRGYYNIFIDEIHRKTFWDVDLKTLYDEHEGRITFSGSSALDITKTSADLSRRVVLKELKPASLREFLNIRKHKNIPPIPFEKIIQDKVNLTKKYTNAFEYFKEYLKYGGLLYPKNGFYEALENSIKKIILQDLSALRDINIKYETDVYKLLYFIARSPPYQTNYSSIATSGDEYEWFLSDLKTASLIEDWIDEVPEDRIVSKYNVGPGDIHNVVETAEWLLHAAREFARMYNFDCVSEIGDLVLRTRNGCKKELLNLISLRGIGRVRARALYNEGFKTVNDLRGVPLQRLAGVKSIGEGVAKSIKRQIGESDKGEDKELSSFVGKK